MKNIVHFLFFVFVCTFAYSCGSGEECMEKRYVSVKAEFYKINVDTVTFISKPALTQVDSFTMQGIGNDSMLYNKVKKMSKINFPLKNLANQSDFLFICNEIKDTVNIYYTSHLNYLSLECGCINTFTLDSILSTNHYIDSISIKSYDINTSDEIQNIYIYHTPK